MLKRTRMIGIVLNFLFLGLSLYVLFTESSEEHPFKGWNLAIIFSLIGMIVSSTCPLILFKINFYKTKANSPIKKQIQLNNIIDSIDEDEPKKEAEFRFLNFWVLISGIIQIVIAIYLFNLFPWSNIRSEVKIWGILFFTTMLLILISGAISIYHSLQRLT